MRFNLVVDIDEQYIDEYLEDHPSKTIGELANELSNACYLGLDCTNAIIMRQFDMGICETYVKKPLNVDTIWGEVWGDNFPTDDQCPIDVLDHHAKANNVIASDDVLNFGRAMWNEGNLTEKLS